MFSGFGKQNYIEEVNNRAIIALSKLFSITEIEKQKCDNHYMPFLKHCFLSFKFKLTYVSELFPHLKE